MATAARLTGPVSLTASAGHRRVESVAVVGLVVAVFAASALGSLRGGVWTTETSILMAGLVIVPGVMLVVSSARQTFSLAESCAWAWHFVFFGLVPAYQSPRNLYYWGARPSEDVLQHAATMVLLAEGVLILLTARRARRRRPPATAELIAGEAAPPPDPPVGGAWLTRLQLIQISATAFVVLLVGPQGLVNGRAAFQRELVGLSEIPGSGTAYFLATCLAIVVPSASIYLRRQAGIGSMPMILASVVMGLLITNPLIGSRFLTGSFVVATVGALTIGRWISRLIPVGMVVALTTLFPSLDLWRGTGAGSQRITLAWPSDSLLKGDFDAFEMLLRAVWLMGNPTLPHPDPGYLIGGALFRWVPLLADKFPDAATGTAVARATGMGFTNVSMPLPGEGIVLGGVLMMVAMYAALGLVFRWLSDPLAASAARAPVDAATASLLFLTLRGSLYSMLGYIILTVLCGVLLAWRPRLPRRRRLRSAP